MIIISARLVSANGPEYDRDLGEITICNDGTGTKTKGNYTVQSKTRTGVVKDYPRLDVSIWNLVHRATGALGFTK